MTSSNARLPVREYTPQQGFAAVGNAVRQIISERSHSFAIAWRIFVRDTKASVRLSYLGYLWLVFPVIANSVVWVFLSSQGVVSIENPGAPYPLFVYLGNLVWTAFTGSLLGGMGVLNEARGTLSKVRFPQESLGIVVLLKNLLTAVIALLCALPLLIWFSVSPGFSGLLFLPCLFGAMLLGLAIGLVCVPVAALIPDFQRLTQLAIRFLFFVAPVVFPLPQTGFARNLMLLNPATPFLVTSRAVLIGGESPQWFTVGIITGLSVIGVICGTVALKIVLPVIIERLEGT